MESNKLNILYFFVIYALISILTGCNSLHKKEIPAFLYGRYDSNNMLVDKNMFSVLKYKYFDMDSIAIYNKRVFLCGFKEKIIEGKGIYRICRNKLMLTHSFYDTINPNKYCSFNKPFLNQHVLLLGIKGYKIHNKNYRIYHFAERNDDKSSYDSYYLEELGFICYYNFDKDDYTLCDSTSVNSVDIRKITKLLIQDTSFFARYTVSKLFPNYFRVKDYKKVEPQRQKN